MEYTEEEKQLLKTILENKDRILDIDIPRETKRPLKMIINLLEKQHEQLERIKEYVHQEIAHYTEDIKDYMDDDKVGNAECISELKENREHWKDIEKILEGKLNDDLYMNWWRYGLYE